MCHIHSVQLQQIIIYMHFHICYALHLLPFFKKRSIVHSYRESAIRQPIMKGPKRVMC